MVKKKRRGKKREEGVEREKERGWRGEGKGGGERKERGVERRRNLKRGAWTGEDAGEVVQAAVAEKVARNVEDG